MSSFKPAYKKRRITPKAVQPMYGTISEGAMKAVQRRTVAAVKRSINRNAEFGAFDTALAFNVDATPEIPATGQLCLVQQGNGSTQRTGDRITVKEVWLRFTAGFVPAAAATAATSAFFWLIYDRQPNGAAAAGTDIFTNDTASSVFPNVSNQKRFKILKYWKWTYNAQAGVTTAYNNVQKSFDIRVKCNLPIEYGASTGAIGDLRSGNIFLFCGTDAASDDTIVADGAARITFTDNGKV